MNVQEGGGGLQISTPLQASTVFAADHQPPLVLEQVPTQGTDGGRTRNLTGKSVRPLISTDCERRRKFKSGLPHNFL